MYTGRRLGTWSAVSVKTELPPTDETKIEPAQGQKPKKKGLSRIQRLALAVNLELLLTWIQVSNIPPLQKMRIRKSIMALYRYIFPAKRSSERRPNQADKQASKADGEKLPNRGRRGANDFSDAERQQREVQDVRPGDPCPCGGVFGKKRILESVQFVAQAPIKVIVNECECLCCSSCDEVRRAKLPENEDGRHHPTAISMVALMKYGSGFPFYRMEAFMGYFGLPLRASTQFEMVAAGIPAVEPVYNELCRQATLGEVLQSDDTSARITKFERPEAFAKRTGIFTTGILSILGPFKIGLFKTGAQHTGEHMTEILESRPADQPTPIFMADALGRNFPKAVEEASKGAKCLSHGRRYFVDLEDAFPKQSRYVLDALGTVFFNDALAKSHNLSPEDRLLLHQTFSRPIMDDLKLRMQTELDEGITEENGRLGKAFRYMLNNWEGLTLFLREPGAPLDNNGVERLLKKAVLHRKNSLFYRTNWGAKVGDIYMSLIYTCELNGVNSFEYLTELQIHADKVKVDPSGWLPWNFRDTLNHLLGIRDEHAPRASPAPVCTALFLAENQPLHMN